MSTDGSQSPQLGSRQELPFPRSEDEVEDGEYEEEHRNETSPPLPVAPPPSNPPEPPEDGWEPHWDPAANAYYFYNRITQKTTWENPRVPSATPIPVPAPGPSDTSAISGGYNPAIHGDYDPNADYATAYEGSSGPALPPLPGTKPKDADSQYVATGFFNRFSGKWQASTIKPENFTDENKSHRQMSAYFDVDAAINNHSGKSLRAERAARKLSKQEVQAFKEKRKERKAERRRAWLNDDR